MKKIFLILSLLTFISCTDLQPRKLTFQEKIAQQIAPGKSTRADILLRFGKPEDRLILDLAGTEVWKYNMTEKRDDDQIYYHELVITIAHTGVVQAYIITLSNKK